MAVNFANWSANELAYELRRQTWPGESTWGVGSCGHPARGCGVCADCIDKELQLRGIDTAADPEQYKRVDGRIVRNTKGKSDG